MFHVPKTSRNPHVIAGLAVGLFSLAVLGFGLDSEPAFVDEWAYVSQSAYLDKLLDRNDPAWLDYAAIDLPPLPKYTIGASLGLFGYQRPPSGSERRWYLDTSSVYGPHDMLVAARWPSVLLGAAGCVALYGLGQLCGGSRVGFLAALLLLANPLYRMHSRRAMADVPAEALALLSLLVSLWIWNRAYLGRIQAQAAAAAMSLAGVVAGLSVLSKLNGGLSLMVIAAWALLLSLFPEVPSARKLLFAGGAALAAGAAFLTFVAGNPLMTCRPAAPPRLGEQAQLADQGLLGRSLAVIQHRAGASQGGQELFPDDALKNPDQKLFAVLVQGFGRFSPLGRKVDLPLERRRDPVRHRRDFDSTQRFDWNQDAGALIWIPLVATGAVLLFSQARQERRAQRAPTGWALLVYAAVAFLTVTTYIPLAWDRYYLSLQPAACLLASAAGVWLWDRAQRTIGGEKAP